MSWTNRKRQPSWPREGSVLRDRHGRFWRVNRTRAINLTPVEQRSDTEYGWLSLGVIEGEVGPTTLVRDGKHDWTGDLRVPAAW